MSTASSKEETYLTLDPWVERRHSKHIVMILPSGPFSLLAKAVFDLSKEGRSSRLKLNPKEWNQGKKPFQVGPERWGSCTPEKPLRHFYFKNENSWRQNVSIPTWIHMISSDLWGRFWSLWKGKWSELGSEALCECFTSCWKIRGKE